jgi:urease accessory protein
MLVVQRRIEPPSHVDAQLVLTFEERRKARQRTRLPDGEEVALFLERGTILRDGDCLASEDGRILRIVAAHEALMEVRTGNAELLARAAYHLGNRHGPIEIHPGAIRFPAGRVLAEMMSTLGLQATPVSASFEPEAGAYAAGHQHHSSEAKHAGIIHDFGRRAP